jgi:nitrogen fixation protein FixH
MAQFKMWPAGIFALLGLNVAVVVTTITLAATSESSVVEERPYERALKWDQEQHRRQASQALHWTCDATITTPDSHASSAIVKVSLTDASGVPVDGVLVGVVAFHHAHAGNRLVLSLAETPGARGVYQVRIEEPAGLPMGLWRLSISAKQMISASTPSVPFEANRDVMLTIQPDSRRTPSPAP